MKRAQANSDKVAKQRGDYARDLHYKNVLRAGLDKKARKERSLRFDAIVEKGIRKGEPVRIAGKPKLVKYVDSNGMVMLEGWTEVDPRNL